MKTKADQAANQFQSSEALQALNDDLRDAYIDYKETAKKCSVEFRAKQTPKDPTEIGSGAKKPETFDSFYFAPDIPLLEEPERQKTMIKDLISEVATKPGPEPVSLLADSLHEELLNSLADQSFPPRCREHLYKFFKRHSTQLQHKKHKLLSRWHSQAVDSKLVDLMAPEFDKLVGRLTQEFESAYNRSERLSVEDSYSSAIDSNAVRPQPVSNEEEGGKKGALLYVESPERSVNSVIRQDDVEVAMRIISYRRKILRGAEKVLTALKWLPYSGRFEIFKASREIMFAFKLDFQAHKDALYRRVEETARKKLLARGVADEKQLNLLTEKYTFHLQNTLTTNYDQALVSFKTNHQQPPWFQLSGLELLEKLVPLASESGISIEDSLQADDGHQVAYQVSGLYPAQFQLQVMLMQFDWVDTGEGTQADTDIILIDRLTSELGLDKHEMLQQMSRRAEAERNKSILGKVNVKSNPQTKKKNTSSPEQEAEEIAQNNLIKRIKELKFFSLESTQICLKKADWLPFVCWTPQVSEFVKTQNATLSNQNVNPIDSVLLSTFEVLDVNEAGATNKILEDAATAHVRKVKAYYAEISKEHHRFLHQSSADEVQHHILSSAAQSSRSSEFPQSGRKATQLLTPDKIEEQLTTLDPLKQHLVKAFYTLRLLKTRTTKVKLLQALNYFRGVQKRLAFEIREFSSRERAMGSDLLNEALIGPQFGTDEFGILKARKTASTQGPGKINATRLERDIDYGDISGADGKQADPISLKGFKYNNQFDPVLTSTCPCVPRFHSTFGRPFLYQEVSAEREQANLKPSDLRTRSASVLALRDRLVFKRATKVLESDIAVLDEHGVSVMYKESLNDLVLLEEEMLKVGSFFVGRAELGSFQKDNDSPVSFIDRSQIAQDLYEGEFEIQVAKIEVVEVLLEAYENTCDPLEQLRLIQVIADVMAIRPRFDLTAGYFQDSYKQEASALKQRLLLYSEFASMLKENETHCNEEVRIFQELKIRKLLDFIQGKWVYNPNTKKVERPGESEELAAIQKQEEQQRLGQTSKMKEMQKQLAMQEIAARHITEFSGNQHTDFADVLGLPEVTANDLFQRKAHQEPLVTDAIREFSTFSKQTEGYPWLHPKVLHDSNPTGLHSGGSAISVFFESLSALSRLHATIQQAQFELEEVHCPESGLATSSLEVALIQEARGKLKLIRAKISEREASDTQICRKIEADSLLDSSDSVLFLARDLKASLNPDTIQKTANPLHVAKLSPKEMEKFDFPRVSSHDVEDFDELSTEVIVARLVDLAKNSVTRQKKKQEAVTEKEEEDKLKVKAPSLLNLFCNCLELHRLREHLLRAIFECEQLGSIYLSQLSLTNKQSWRLTQQDPLFPPPQSLGQDQMNLVDCNDGTKLAIDLAVTEELDSSLKANLDFQSESCVKALLLPLGVEELRAVVAYQLMQKHLLTVAVMRNQEVLDGPLRGLAELSLLQKRPHSLTVPGPVISVLSCLQRAVDGPHGEKCRREQTRLNSDLSKDVAERMYSVTMRKSKHRAQVQKQYSAFVQKVSQLEVGKQTKLRVLRSFRIRLTLDFCSSVLKDVYHDSLAIQTLRVCSKLRRMRPLFPQDATTLEIGRDSHQELLPLDLSRSGLTSQSKNQPTLASLDQLLKGRPGTLLYVPTSLEILDSFKELENRDLGYSISSDPSSPMEVDSLLRHSVLPPNYLSPAQLTDQLGSPCLRLFQEAFDFNSPNLHLLLFYHSLFQISTLEYLKGRNHSKSEQVLELEAIVRSGLNFWNSVQNEAKKIEDNSTQGKVVAKIMEQKRARQDLAEDMRQIGEKVSSVNELLKGATADQLKIGSLAGLMHLKHQASFYRFLSALETAQDIYLDHSSSTNFSKIRLAQEALSRRDQGINLLGNGFYISQSPRSPLALDLGSLILEDHDQFLTQHNPVVNEQALVPSRISLVKNLFGIPARKEIRASPGFGSSFYGGYREMRSSFFNMDDEQRQFIAANCYNQDEGVREYLVLKGVVPNPRANKEENQISVVRPIEVLETTVQFLTLKAEARHVQRVVMTWVTNSAVPVECSAFSKALEKYRENAVLKILLEKDRLVESYYSAKKSRDEGEMVSRAAANAKKLKQERTAVMEAVNTNSKEHRIISRYFQMKAEITVGRRIIEVDMIKTSLQMIRQEDAALKAAFDQGAADGQVHAFVHPQQQFASTLYQQVDPNGHLDVVSKLGFVQAFLTKLRNRCTEVETLASGPGIVFSLKDFNDCLQILCKGLIKYGETELRSRVETQHLRENQLQHLLYLKDKQSLYFRRKCEQFLSDLDKLVNAKISQKGSQLIYEMDLSQRELKVLKDNYSSMKSFMLEQLRHEFQRTIQEQRNRIEQLETEAKAHRDHVVATTICEVNSNFRELEERVDKKKRDAALLNNELKKPPSISTLKKGARLSQQPQIANQQKPDSEETAKLWEEKNEAMEETIALRTVLRKQRAFTLLKQVVAQEKHEKDLANQRAQLTSNAALWDQLAEAEKREQITRQELLVTKQSLASYEKLIERLQGQLESLNNQKARLQQFKNTKSKRIDELEAKMKDLEILENIDLNKIISELKSRDRRIDQLEGQRPTQESPNKRLDAERKIAELERQLEQERNLKQEAYKRLEAVRTEMQAMEGQDDKSEVWREKCRDLYSMCRSLEQENEQLREVVKQANRAHLTQEQEFRDSAPMSTSFSYQQPGRAKSSKTLGREQLRNNYKSVNHQAYTTVEPSGKEPLSQSLNQSSKIFRVEDSLPSKSFNFGQALPEHSHWRQRGPDMLSVTSAGLDKRYPNQIGGEGVAGLPGGVFAVPLQNSQPRTIMTAAGGQRAQMRSTAFKSKGDLKTNEKRLQTSQGGTKARLGGKPGAKAMPMSGRLDSMKTGSSVPYSSVQVAFHGQAGLIQGKQVIPSESHPSKQASQYQ